MAANRWAAFRWNSSYRATRVIIHRDGDRLVIDPVRKRGLPALLKTMEPLSEDFPEIDDPVPTPTRVQL
jgi:virulence-associated protein VagC